jgi:hypothetical protein
MLVYKRSGDTVTPYWINTITGVPERLTFKQLVQAGDVPSANEPFLIKGVPHRYSRINWFPYYVQPDGRYTNPRLLKTDGSRITDNDWFYQGE